MAAAVKTVAGVVKTLDADGRDNQGMKILACFAVLTLCASPLVARPAIADSARASAPVTTAVALASASESEAPSAESSSRSAVTPPTRAFETLRRAAELNILFAFVGIFDMKLLLPVVRAGERDFRGELIFGAYSDYSWGPLSRPADEYGKVLLLAGRIGYRQNLVHGLHVEASTYLGWRHEEENVHDGSTVDGFVGRLWLYGGWQRDLSPRFYANVRGGLGIHLFRTDHLGHKEKELVPAGDIGLGVRF